MGRQGCFFLLGEEILAQAPYSVLVELSLDNSRPWVLASLTSQAHLGCQTLGVAASWAEGLSAAEPELISCTTLPAQMTMGMTCCHSKQTKPPDIHRLSRHKRPFFKNLYSAWLGIRQPVLGHVLGCAKGMSQVISCKNLKRRNGRWIAGTADFEMSTDCLAIGHLPVLNAYKSGLTFF